MNQKTIRGKLFTTIIPMLLLAIVANSVVNILSFRYHYSTALEEKSYAISKNVRGTIYTNMGFFPLDSFTGMTDYLQRVLKDNNGISYCFIADDSLKILYHHDESQIGQHLDKNDYPSFQPDDKITIPLDDFYESVIPIIWDDKVVGTIHIGVEKQLINGRTNEMFFQSLLVLIVATAISGYSLYYFLSKIIISPLMRLSETVEYINTNKSFERRVGVEQQDEIGTLATLFNKMMIVLEEHYTALEIKTMELREAQKKLEQTNEYLALNEKKYRTLFESSKDTIFITTPIGQFIDINPACFELLEYTREEILHMNAIDVYAQADDRSRFRKEMSQQGSVTDFAVKFRQKSGREIDVLLTATLWQAKDGSELGFQGIARDITAQRQAEQERLKLTAIQRELDVAREIQQNLLPQIKPDWPELDVVCYNLPAHEVGGDFYAYHAFNQSPNLLNQAAMERYVIAIGDVSGKGAPAALLMAVSLVLFQAALSQDLSPTELLEYLDEALTPYTHDKRQNCALIYTQINVTTLTPYHYTMQFANAGCIPPYIKRNSGEIEFDENIGGFALGQGFSTMIGYRQHTVQLFAGDMVILTSDGVVEANNKHGEMLGFERLMTIIKDSPSTNDAEITLEYLKREIFAFTGEAEQHDDITVVVIQV